mmetsp:Transcript_61667/g.133949  ORF Transcript_61667/g.133949 Transcript_61667/m.133949 type:complete len:200 (+) Transcript_61667:190-789(+)
MCSSSSCPQRLSSSVCRRRDRFAGLRRTCPKRNTGEGQRILLAIFAVSLHEDKERRRLVVHRDDLEHTGARIQLAALSFRRRRGHRQRVRRGGRRSLARDGGQHLFLAVLGETADATQRWCERCSEVLRKGTAQMEPLCAFKRRCTFIIKIATMPTNSQRLGWDEATAGAVTAGCASRFCDLDRELRLFFSILPLSAAH